MRSILFVFLALSFISCAPKPSSHLDSEVGIVGGHDTRTADRATQRLLSVVVRIHMEHLDHTNSLCSGAMIARNVVLTAAHCMLHKPVLPSQITVQIAYFNARGKWQKSIRKVRAFVVHPMYTYDNKKVATDMALLQLEQAFSPLELPEPAQLPPPNSKPNDFYSYGPFLAAGYGRTRDVAGVADKGLPELPHYMGYLPATQEYFESPDLSDPDLKDFARDFLANEKVGGFCFGDSGGPLLGTFNGHVTVFGVISSHRQAWETPAMRDEFEQVKDDEAKTKAFFRKYPKHRMCMGGTDHYTDVTMFDFWVREVLAKFTGA